MIWNIAGIIIPALLKILGILLLILLVLILLVLLAPIRYRFSAVFHGIEAVACSNPPETESLGDEALSSDQYKVWGSVSWLWFLIRFPFSWKDGQLQWKFQILGIPFLKSGKRGGRNRSQDSRRKPKKSQNDKKAEQKTVPDQKSQKDHTEITEKTDLTEQETRQPEDRSDPISRDADVNQGEKADNTVPARYKQPEDVENKKKHKKQSLFQRLWQKIKECYQAVCDMIRNIREKVHSAQDLIQLLQKDSSRRFICIAKENMLQLLRHLKPQKIKGDIRFGTGDPCTTGQILGGIAVFYSWIGTGLHITPDFEEACFEGKIAVKGRIRMITMLVILIRLMISKEFRTLRRELKQWKEDL